MAVRTHEPYRAIGESEATNQAGKDAFRTEERWRGQGGSAKTARPKRTGPLGAPRLVLENNFICNLPRDAAILPEGWVTEAGRHRARNTWRTVS